MFGAFTLPAWAQTVKVDGPWVQATVAGQKATAAFMKLTADAPVRLTGGKTPVAPVVEIHEMVMDGDVMKMRAIEGGLPLEAGKTVELKPGGYHVMLIDLPKAVEVGQNVPLTLTFTDAQGKTFEVAVEAPVRPLKRGHEKKSGHGM
ncbi:MAG: copper chaperone PCu(A)C [Rhodocyclales bacterium]|nr:copper chaperone PCu(A)C [Rhodocyclales bacterium]